MPTRDAIEKLDNSGTLGSAVFGFKEVLNIRFFMVNDIGMIFFIHELMCTSFSCLAKEDPDNNASFCLLIKQRERARCTNVDPCVPVRSNSVSLL